MSPTTQASIDVQLAEAVAECYADPLRFVLMCYPWGEPGPLEPYTGPDTWQRNFLIRLGEEVKARQFDGTHAVLPIRMVVSSGHGIGKALAISVDIPTPSGLRRFGDLAIGDQVFAEDGTPTEITNVFPQGARQLYRLTFDDGSSVEADGDHLWKVRGRQERRGQLSTWRTLTTLELVAAGVRRSNGKTRCRTWEIPIQGAAQFLSRDVPVHPYTLGVWLGDGGRKSSRISSADPEVIAHLREVGETVTKNSGPHQWAVSLLCPKLRTLGIADAYSYQKAVPPFYMENSIEVRSELLRGLLDTDGECSTGGAVVFSSCSLALATDVVWLARSLGGKARLQPTVKQPAYTGADGAKVRCRPCWRATLTMPPDFQCFYIARKQERVRRVEARYLSRWIDRIEPTRVEEAMCITIAHPSACYLANDFIVTHNSTLVAWLVNWIMSTRPHAKGSITANTYTQLETKTWAAIQTWTQRCLTRHWFTITASQMSYTAHRSSWFCTPISSEKEKSEAFAGQQAAESTSFYLFDEASAVPDIIFEVAEGGLAKGEPMMFLFGNPTRNSGKFYEAAFGVARDRWITTTVDAESCAFANRDLIREWIQDYGEDSDFVRVRVRGLPPSASDAQFIDAARVHTAKRATAQALSDDPLIAGVDVPDKGPAWFVCRFRRGQDARTIAPIRLPGDPSPDYRNKLIAILAERLRDDTPERKIAAMFIDSAFGSPIVERLRVLGFRNVHEIRFGGDSPDPHYANQRAYQWGRMKDWLATGAIPGNEPRLEADLTAPGFHLDRRDRLVLESKESMAKRGVASPDDGDALSLTFAQPVAVPKLSEPPYAGPRPPAGPSAWMS